MLLPLRYELIGQYGTPRFRIGDNLLCAIRGTVRVVGVSDGLIPWPIGRAEGSRALSYVICGDLEKALSVEAGSAVAHWWGVRRLTVSKWRKALGLTEATAGTKRLRAANGSEPNAVAARAEGIRRHGLPDSRQKHSKAARRKMSDSHRGIPLSEEHRQKISEGQRGRVQSEETRRKISQSRRRAD
jgi:hypothetical protein